MQFAAIMERKSLPHLETPAISSQWPSAQTSPLPTHKYICIYFSTDGIILHKLFYAFI